MFPPFLTNHLCLQSLSLPTTLSKFLSQKGFKMEMDINLELSLSSSLDSNRCQTVEEEYESPRKQVRQSKQKLTIFYNGKICVCDVTELQAATILMLAKKETEEKVRIRSESKASSPILQSKDELSRASTGLMMKRSLQRFLQKRKNRIQEACPYYH